MKPSRPLVVAITGGIGTGKSLVCDYIKSLGYPVIDFDKIGHFVLESDLLTKDRLVKVFGDQILKGTEIDRKILGDIVFKDREKLELLSKITHPRIYDLGEKEINMAKSDLVFLEIPLLFETRDKYPEFYRNVDSTWVVTTDYDRQIEWLTKRDGVSTEEAEIKIKAQKPLKEKEELADVVIKNMGDKRELYSLVDGELGKLKV